MNPNFTMNKDYERREQIIFGESYDSKKYPGGCRDFMGMTVETLQQLVDEKFADTEDNQNYAPTLGELLEYGKTHKGVTFGGYAIEVARDDYRVSIDTIDQDFNEDANASIDFSNAFHAADEFTVAKESGHAWWD